MTPPLPSPETPFEFALSQLTAEVKPHVLRTMHALITNTLTATLTAPEGNREEQQAESRALAKMLRVIEKQLGNTAFSSVAPKEQIRYVSPSQLPGAATSQSTEKPRRKATPRGKAQS